MITTVRRQVWHHSWRLGVVDSFSIPRLRISLKLNVWEIFLLTRVQNFDFSIDNNVIWMLSIHAYTNNDLLLTKLDKIINSGLMPIQVCVNVCPSPHFLPLIVELQYVPLLHSVCEGCHGTITPSLRSALRHKPGNFVFLLPFLISSRQWNQILPHHLYGVFPSGWRQLRILSRPWEWLETYCIHRNFSDLKL